VRVATQYASTPCKLTISSYLFARWHLFRHVDYLRHQQQVDLWPFDLETGVRVTCDVGYLSANFSLPRPLCSRVRPDIRDRQTSDVRHMSPPYVGRRHNKCSAAVGNHEYKVVHWYNMPANKLLKWTSSASDEEMMAHVRYFWPPRTCCSKVLRWQWLRRYQLLAVDQSHRELCSTEHSHFHSPARMTLQAWLPSNCVTVSVHVNQYAKARILAASWRKCQYFIARQYGVHAQRDTVLPILSVCPIRCENRHIVTPFWRSGYSGRGITLVFNSPNVVTEFQWEPPHL